VIYCTWVKKSKIMDLPYPSSHDFMKNIIGSFCKLSCCSGSQDFFYKKFSLNLILHYIRKLLCIFLAQTGPWKEDFKRFFPLKHVKNGLPYCGPSQPPGTMNVRKLILHYIRKLSCKYELFWPHGLRRFLNDSTLFWHLYDFLPFQALKRTWPFIRTRGP
jgi:hypothetical protein